MTYVEERIERYKASHMARHGYEPKAVKAAIGGVDLGAIGVHAFDEVEAMIHANNQIARLRKDA